MSRFNWHGPPGVPWSRSLCTAVPSGRHFLAGFDTTCQGTFDSSVHQKHTIAGVDLPWLDYLCS